MKCINLWYVDKCLKWKPMCTAVGDLMILSHLSKSLSPGRTCLGYRIEIKNDLSAFKSTGWLTIAKSHHTHFFFISFTDNSNRIFFFWLLYFFTANEVLIRTSGRECICQIASLVFMADRNGVQCREMYIMTYTPSKPQICLHTCVGWSKSFLGAVLVPKNKPFFWKMGETHTLLCRQMDLHFANIPWGLLNPTAPQNWQILLI